MSSLLTACLLLCCGQSHSRMIACSGHEWAASLTWSSWSPGTISVTADAWPSTSSSWNESGAIIEHRVWPWQRCPSTETFTSTTSFASDVVVVPLEITPAVNAHLHPGHVPRLLGGEEQDHVADV